MDLYLGKTTTMSILTGLFAPSSGDCLVDGFRVSDQMEEIRLNVGLGVTPQHNVLFDQMTVKEHLDMYCVLKGVPKKQIPKSVETIIDEVGLKEKTNVLSSALSGGMKRRLQLAIALVGDSKVIYLDEPTSGK